MTGLPCGEETMTIRQAVSMEYHNVTDRQIDGRTNGQTDRIAISISRVSVLIKAVSVSPCVKDSVIISVVYIVGPVTTAASTVLTTTVSESTSQFTRSPDDTSSTLTSTTLVISTSASTTTSQPGNNSSTSM